MALIISKYFIKKSQAEASVSGIQEVTNLKLQKLLYYAQGWHLANFHQKLFDEPIEAWRYGPAVRTVYEKYRIYGAQPITETVLEEDLSDLNEETASFLDEIWAVFRGYSGTELIYATHQEMPWKTAWKESSKNKNIGCEIDSTLLESFFGSLKNAT